MIEIGRLFSEKSPSPNVTFLSARGRNNLREEQAMFQGFKRATGAGLSVRKAVLWELDRLARPCPNGDGCGAAAVDSGILAAARGFVQALLRGIPYRPQVVPTASGKLQLVWYRGLESLELTFDSPQTLSFSTSYGEAGTEEEATFSVAEVDRAVALVEEFRNRTSKPALPRVERLSLRSFVAAG
jgi:hypothetical protein